MEKCTDRGQELARLSKIASEDLRLTLRKRGIGQYLDIWVWSKIRPMDDALSNPTEHGLVLAVDLLPDFRRAITQAIDAVGGEPDGETLRIEFGDDVVSL